MTRCVKITKRRRRCSGKALPGTDRCSHHSDPPKDRRQCIGTTWSGKRCSLGPRAGEDYCQLHTPYPERVTMYFIARNLKPYERLPNGRYRRYAYPKLFHTRGAANWWMQDNWEVLMNCQPGKRVVSASVEAVKVKNTGVYVRVHDVERTFPANGE